MLVSDFQPVDGVKYVIHKGKFVFQDITDSLQKVTDPEELRKFQDNCVTIAPEEKKETWTAAFSPAAMTMSPVIADAAKEVYGEAGAAIGKFYDGTLSAEELSDTYERLSGKLQSECEDRGYPMPLWSGAMGPALQECFYGEFRRMVLDEAVQRNNAEGKHYIPGELTAQRNWTYYNSDYYYRSEDAISALTDKFNAMAQAKGWEDKVSVPDYKARGLNLYNNFNSALSNHFNVDDQFIIDTDQVPPRDFRWFYQSGGSDGRTTSVTSLTIEQPDGTTEFIDYTTPDFDPTDPMKGTTWAAYKDENGQWQYDSADFTYDYSKADLKNVASLLEFAGKSGASRDAAAQFIKNLRLYPAGYFSRFPQYGALGMDMRA